MNNLVAKLRVSEGVIGHGPSCECAGHHLQQRLELRRSAEHPAAPVARGHARELEHLRVCGVQREPHPGLNENNSTRLFS